MWFANYRSFDDNGFMSGVCTISESEDHSLTLKWWENQPNEMYILTESFDEALMFCRMKIKTPNDLIFINNDSYTFEELINSHFRETHPEICI